MEIVNHCSFKKLTVSLLSVIFPFHVYLQPLALHVQKNPKKPPGLDFFLKKTRVFLNPGFRPAQTCL